jgi:phosphoglycolate phosphatase
VTSASRAPVVVFDLDGTLLDSDAALAAAFTRLGVPLEQVTYGHVIGEECARLGLHVADYVAAYDPADARPFDGVPELLAALGRWGVCSNKAGRSGRAELRRWGWRPSVAWFTEDFGGGPKRLAPVLEALGVAAADAVYVGDSAHDATCAAQAGCRFAVAAWNPRTRAAGLTGDVVLARPADLLDVLGAGRR